MFDPLLKSSVVDVIHSLTVALASGQEAYLVTVLNTWGSSPRPPGSMMVWSGKQGITGSVSGGCIEQDLIERLKQGEFASELPTELIFGENHEQAEALKLPCGGVLRILLENIRPTQLIGWAKILTLLESRNGVSRQLAMKSGRWSHCKSRPHALQEGPLQLRHYMGPVRKLLIVGANPISYYLAQYASSLDFNVTVCDPSPHLGEQWHNAGFEFLPIYPDGIVERDFADEHSAVVAVSHDPRLDDMALMEALTSDAYYIGAMGSARTSALRRQRLLQLDLSERQLSKLHAPIGLDIGSKTPAEIAVSIAAHLVAQCKLFKQQPAEGSHVKQR